MKRPALWLWLLCALLVGCQPSQSDSRTPSSGDISQINVDLNAPNTTVQSEPTTTTAPAQATDDQVYSLLNGLPISQAASQRRPLAVMIDNHRRARPQAGLYCADIVYEILVEGQITRYMAIFQSEMPELIGPIRSARPYFLSCAMPFDAIYAHVGGSSQALAEIDNYKVASVSGLSSGNEVFWREDHKKIPNNMYASYHSLTTRAKQRGYRQRADIDGFSFNGDYDVADAQELSSLQIVYAAPYSVNGITYSYKIAFQYDPSTKRYLRYVKDEAHLDEKSGVQLYADSIIVQKAATSVIDNEGRLAIELIGSGSGYYLYDGKVIPIQWQKNSKSEQTHFYSDDFQPLALKRGKLWIQIVKDNYQLERMADDE